MPHCYFVSDLHGNRDLYAALFDKIRRDPPDMVFIGGDILPHGYHQEGTSGDFIRDCLQEGFQRLQQELRDRYPQVCLIPGNDDPRANEEKIRRSGEEKGLWDYIHNRKVQYGDYHIYGYAFIPPSPFGLKDWEKYDVSRFVDPGCTHPFEGMRTVSPDYDPEYSNIRHDLENLVKESDLSRAVFLFHSPPYDTPLDRAALDGQMIDHVPLDVHVGSIAIQRFIEARQPLLTLHGHIHEASRITGTWRSRMGNTYMFNASYHQNVLALVEFELEDLENARRVLI